MAATSLLLGIFCARLYNESLEADVDLPSVLPVFMISVSFMFVATIYMLFGALKFSHRIAGPMYNMGLTLERYMKGQVTARVKLRKHDYLTEVADHINEFLEWLEEHPPTNYEEIVEEARQAAEAAAAAAAEDDKSDGTDGEGSETETPAETTATATTGSES